MSHQSELIESDIGEYLRQHQKKELLRLLTCGSVDDGKSTLIGRLLYDSKMVYEDQLAAVKDASARHGTTDTDFDPALLTDGLRAEREQGITIDVAYRYFSTARRKFIIADTPGHEQYTRNMATGASTCELAVILIDARYGVQTQTRRHSYIASLLGIRHVVVAINKMDLVDWSEAVYSRIRAEYDEFSDRLGIPDVRFVPMSALLGDNVVHSSENLPWYQGATLMHILEHVHIASDRNLRDFRLPVQYVNRPNLDFRGFCGTIASGIVRPGDAVMALPSRKRSRVKAVVTYEGEEAEAFASMAVTVTLDDEIDVSRGDMLVHPDNLPRVGTQFDATVVWMAEEPLTCGRPYIVKHTTARSPAVVTALKARIDVNSLAEIEGPEQLGLNEIGICRVSLARPIAFDDYQRNRTTGAFIMVDRVTNNTVGAGMITAHSGEAGPSTEERYDALTVDVQVRESHVSASQREARLGHKAASIWLTGRTGSGKRTIAYALEKRLFDAGVNATVIDGYNARLGLNIDLDMALEATGPCENVRRTAEVARLFAQAGSVPVVACLAPTRDGRAWARRILSRESDVPHFEVFLDAPPEVCQARCAEPEPLGPGFETSTGADLVLKTAEMTVDACVEAILELVGAAIGRHV